MYTIYVVRQNADLTEGRGPMMPKAYFASQDDASEFALTLPGVMGTRQGVDVGAIHVHESLDEHPDWTIEKIRQTALEKLTDLEKQALGLTK